VTCFCSIGEVVGVHIQQTKSGRSLGSGIVEFSSPEYANKAIESMNGQDLNGRAIAVRAYFK
jgi:RNA recognition motif-containing protein